MEKELETKEAALQVVKDQATASAKETVVIEMKAAKEATEAAQNEATEAKAETAKIAVKYDEQQKQLDKLSAKLNDGMNTTKKGKSFNEVFEKAMTESTDDIKKFERKETKSFSIELKAVGDVTTGNVTGGSLYGQNMAPGIIELPKRKTHIRSILPGGSIGPGTSFTFMRENGIGEGDPAPVAEGGLKPQLDLDLVESTVQIETVAGWVRVTRKAMNNIPGFISFLQSRLPERLFRVEDNQILYGNGTTPNLKGILTAGNFVASTSTAATLAEKIIDDMARLEDSYERIATGILLRPIQYFNFFKNKASGSGEYDLPQNVIFNGGMLYISGVPVYASTALTPSVAAAGTTAATAGDYVVGDWANGAQLLIQEGMRIEFFEQDVDNVQRNKVTVRIEETVALPVYGPDYFIKGTVPL